MSVVTTAHLNFRGEARAALEFYQSVFGGELALVADPAKADQLMWGQVQGASGIHLMAYDVPAQMPYDQGVNSLFVSIRGEDADEITAYWKGLAEGAEVVQDLGAAGWSTLYGMLRDRFGVVWVLDVSAAVR